MTNSISWKAWLVLDVYVCAGTRVYWEGISFLPERNWEAAILELHLVDWELLINYNKNE